MKYSLDYSLEEGREILSDNLIEAMNHTTFVLKYASEDHMAQMYDLLEETIHKMEYCKMMLIHIDRIHDSSVREFFIDKARELYTPENLKTYGTEYLSILSRHLFAKELRAFYEHALRDNCDYMLLTLCTNYNRLKNCAKLELQKCAESYISIEPPRSKKQDVLRFWFENLDTDAKLAALTEENLQYLRFDTVFQQLKKLNDPIKERFIVSQLYALYRNSETKINFAYFFADTTWLLTMLNKYQDDQECYFQLVYSVLCSPEYNTERLYKHIASTVSQKYIGKIDFDKLENAIFSKYLLENKFYDFASMIFKNMAVKIQTPYISVYIEGFYTKELLAHNNFEIPLWHLEHKKYFDRVIFNCIFIDSLFEGLDAEGVQGDERRAKVMARYAPHNLHFKIPTLFKYCDIAPKVKKHITDMLKALSRFDCFLEIKYFLQTKETLTTIHKEAQSRGLLEYPAELLSTVDVMYGPKATEIIAHIDFLEAARIFANFRTIYSLRYTAKSWNGALMCDGVFGGMMNALCSTSNANLLPELFKIPVFDKLLSNCKSAIERIGLFIEHSKILSDITKENMDGTANAKYESVFRG